MVRHTAPLSAWLTVRRVELGIHQMPVFRRGAKSVVQVELPRPQRKGAGVEAPMKLDLNEDVKMCAVLNESSPPARV